MTAPLRNPLKFDIQNLITVIKKNTSSDGFTPALTTEQWDLLAGYLQPFALAQGQRLIEQGAIDRTLYLIESGSLTVHYEDDKGRVRLAVVEAGSAVGEGAFFSRLPRNATVQAASAARLWCLTPIRFSELTNRQPAVALEIAMGLGSLVSRRLMNKPRRVAVT
jgi:CRP/FNR family cyclic AMP-dependent transcriptional regulator